MSETNTSSKPLREVVPANPAIRVGQRVLYSVGKSTNLVGKVESIDEGGYAMVQTASGKLTRRHTTKLQPAPKEKEPKA